jgi:ArsR family transcriptional regulator, arsenate/arsenite/antimonite-responsive transcriptional repressor
MDDTNRIARGPDLLDLKKMLNALAVEARLAMLVVLAATDEVTVTDLGQLLAERGYFVSQPLVSWHIRALKVSGFVRTRRLGRQVYCSLDRARYEQCLRMLGELAPPRSGPSATSGAAPGASAGILGRSL